MIIYLYYQNRKLLIEANQPSTLDKFQTWLNQDEKRKADLPDWDKILREVKEKRQAYYLSESNWASGLLARNWNYWRVFKDWLDTDYD